ncbi:MAG TPA: hypothetical protein VN397_04310 [Candidatus Methylomirabilis sp.]|nr:hypothetical protein [Candidatus Methylomirabilis sp.]
MKSQMVTKDYLDVKLADQYSDVVQFVRRRVSCWKDIGVQKTAG